MIAWILLMGGWKPVRLCAAQDSANGATVRTNSLLDPEFGVGAWIWSAHAEDKQTCLFWRPFEIPGRSRVEEARLRITADNGYRAFLDGRGIGLGSDWRSLTEYDLTWVLQPGIHVLAIQAFNDRLACALPDCSRGCWPVLSESWPQEHK